MSDEEKKSVVSQSKQTKVYSIITAVIVLVKTVVEIFFNN